MPALLRGKTSKHHSDFYYLYCLHAFATKKGKSHKKYVKMNIFVTLGCLLNLIKYQNLMNIKNFKKGQFILYADLEFLIERINGCKNNPVIHNKRR